MPKFTFECVDCQFSKSVLRPSLPPPGWAVCAECKKPMVRASSAPTARMVETLDNGLMTRRIERPANAEQLYKDRARNSELDKNKL